MFSLSCLHEGTKRNFVYVKKSVTLNNAIFIQDKSEELLLSTNYGLILSIITIRFSHDIDQMIMIDKSITARSVSISSFVKT
jgi:hypothetical protein